MMPSPPHPTSPTQLQPQLQLPQLQQFQPQLQLQPSQTQLQPSSNNTGLNYIPLLNPGNIINNNNNNNTLILSISYHMSMIKDYMSRVNQHYAELEQIVNYLKNQNY